MRRQSVLLLLALLALLSSAVLAVETDTPKDLRGDEGVLMDLRPTGAVFTAPDRILVTDSRYNQFHVFDPEGRRYVRLDVPRDLPLPWYNGIAQLDDGSYLMVGSHYHEKNTVRYVTVRSVLHRYTMEGEKWRGDSAEVNYDPDTALRRTGFLGQTVKTPMEIGGIAVDPKQKRLFFGLTRPLAEDGSVLIYEARLPEVLELKKNLEFKDVKTKLVPPEEPALGQKFFLSDLAYVPGKGLLVLMASQSPDGKTFGSNQIWMLRGGFGPAKLVAKEIAPGNRATGLAVREESKNTYTLGLVFDNNPEDTGIPSRIMLMKGFKL